jgi:hypothetical protein
MMVGNGERCSVEVDGLACGYYSEWDELALNPEENEARRRRHRRHGGNPNRPDSCHDSTEARLNDPLPGVRCYSDEELLALEFPAPEWAIRAGIGEEAPGLVPRSSLVMVGGASNVGKSWCVLQLALADAADSGGRVLYVGGETDESYMQERVRGLAPRRGTFHWYDRDGLDLSSAQGLDELISVVRDLQPTHVILDTLSSLAPGIEVNESQRLGSVIAGWRAIRAVAGSRACVWSIHHTTKATWRGGEEPSLSDLAGRGMLTAAIDTGLVLMPMPNAEPGALDVAVHVVKQRSRQRARTMRLTVRIDTQRGNVWTWSEGPTKSQGTGDADGPLPYEREVLELLPELGGGQSPGGSNKVAEALGCPAGRAREAILKTLKLLGERGVLVRGTGGRWFRAPRGSGPETDPGTTADHSKPVPLVPTPLGVGPGTGLELAESGQEEPNYEAFW